MQLKVSIEESSKSYTLKPTRKYLVGNSESCDILLSQATTTSEHCLEFRYESDENCWSVDRKGIRSNASTAGHPNTRRLIKSNARFRFSEEVTLILIPEIVNQQDESTGQAPVNVSSQGTGNEFKEIHSTPILSSPAITNAQANANPVNHNSEYSSRELANRIPVINLGFKWFRIGSPEDGVGLRFHAFNLYQTYHVGRLKLEPICEKLYERVYQAVHEGTLGDAKVRTIKFRKSTLSGDDSRRYVLVTRDTVHGSRTTIFVRFLSYGDNLYLGLDVYYLGEVNWLKLLLKILITSVLLSFYWAVFPLFVIPILWWKLIWRINYEKKLGLAFRQEFPGKTGNGPFDVDDLFMFTKSTTHLAVKTVRDVFKEEKIPVDSLDSFIQNINNITIDTGGGGLSMIGSVIGTDNKIET